MARPLKLPIDLALLVALVAIVLWGGAAPTPASAAQHQPSGRASHGDARKGRHRGRHAHHHRRHKHGRRHGRRIFNRKQQTSRGSIKPAVAVSSPPATATSSSDLLFEGSRVGDFWVDHSAPEAISEVADPAGSGESVLQMDVHDADVYPITPTENPRAELLSPDIIEPGDEFWLATKFLLPTDLPPVPGWLSLVSLYGPPFEGASPWHVAVDDDTLRWQRNETYGYDVPWEAPLVKGRWVTVLAHERFATDGWVEMWIDGQQIEFFGGDTYNPGHVAPTSRLEMQTMDASNGGGANSAKIMQYREAGMIDDASVYFGALKLGTTRASVGA